MPTNNSSLSRPPCCLSLTLPN